MLRDQVVPALRNYFAPLRGEFVAAYLFGSVARGQERPDSDVDVAVVLGRRRGPELADLDRLAVVQGQLCDLLGREVDLVPLDRAGPDLQHRVLLDRILLLDGDHDARIEFEVQVHNEYFDLQPHLEQYRRAVLRRA